MNNNIMSKNRNNPFLSNIKEERKNNFGNKKKYNTFKNDSLFNNFKKVTKENDNNDNNDNNEILEKIKELKETNKKTKKVDITKLFFENDDKQNNYTLPDIKDNSNISNNIFLRKKQQKVYTNRFINDVNINNNDNDYNNNSKSKEYKEEKYAYLCDKYNNF